MGEPAVFMGEHFHSLDEKNRLIMPAKFRLALGERFIATKGLEGCVFVYPESEWNVLEQNLRDLPFTKGDFRAFSRLFFSGASECEFDKQGRFVLPQNLREYAKIDRDVAVVGVSNRVEIWSKALWQEYQEGNYPAYESLAEKIVNVSREG